VLKEIRRLQTSDGFVACGLDWANPAFWTSKQIAVNGGFEPTLPIFCHAADVCYYGKGKSFQQLLGL
jgi:hypothetical protein